MAKCKCCHKKGFAVETDANGLCSVCSPYYYVSMNDDLKVLKQSLTALNRIDHPAAAGSRVEMARECLHRLLPYAEAGLVKLPEPADQIEAALDAFSEQWPEMDEWQEE